MKFFTNMTLRKKLVFSFLIVLFITFVTIITMNVHSVNVEKKMLAERKSNIVLFDIIVRSKLSHLEGFARNYARHPKLVNLVAEFPDSASQVEMQQWLQNHLKSNTFDVITVTDNQGYVIARGSNPTVESNRRRLYSPFVTRALKGETVVGFDEIIENELEAERLLDNIQQLSGMTDKRGLMLKSTAPIKVNNEIIGTLTTGYLLNNNEQLVNACKEKLPNVLETAIYHNVTKIAANGNELPNTLTNFPALYQGVNDTILVTVHGKKHAILSRRFITDLTGKPIGALVLIEWDPVFDSYQSRRKFHLILFFVIAAMLGGLSLYLIDHNLSKPIRDFQEAISRAEDGDFSTRVAFGGDDELGQLGQCFNSMIDKIETMVEQERKRGQELQLLNKSTKDISVIHDLELLWHLIMERVITVMKVDACSLYLKDQITGRLECKLSGGSGTEGVEPNLLLAGEKIAEQVVENGKTQKLKVERERPVNGHKFDSLISAPLITRNEVIGALNIYNKENRDDFTDNDVSLLSTLAGQAAISINNANLYNLVGERERMKKELEIARSIQKELRPTSMPNIANLNISGSMKQIDEVGGDYLDFFPNSDGTRVAIALGSVLSRGVEASIIKMMVKTVLHCLAGQIHSPKEVLTLVNEILAGNLEEKELMALFFGIWDANKKTLTYANAGHEFPIVYHGLEGSCQQLVQKGRLIGKYNDFDLLIKDAQINISPDDRVILFSTGLVKMKNAQNEPFGEAKMINVVRENGHLDAPDLRKLILDAVTNHSGNVKTTEDISLLVLQGK